MNQIQQIRIDISAAAHYVVAGCAIRMESTRRMVNDINGNRI